LNVRETARQLGVHENTVRNWVSAGILKSARLPGARFHKFYAEDVERLRLRRGKVAQSVKGERRTIGPELIDATQLGFWASTRGAQAEFPELVRRLLAATTGITNISIRAGDGVSVSGWDGRADSAGTSYLPAGKLWFEFGVGSRPRAKADDDYEKRRADPGAASPHESIFVFVTPRRWQGGTAWATRRRDENVFADVRVLDGDDLEGWLQTTSGVHHWISERLGRRPGDAETLSQWWARFQLRTDPALPTDLFLAGREGERDQLMTFLRGDPGVLTIEADWRDDVIAFVAAAVDRTAESEASGPALVVSSPDVWARIADRQERSTTLIPVFPEPDVQTVQRNGHHVVLPLGRDQLIGGQRLRLPRPNLVAAAEALRAAGVAPERTHELAALARRSLPSLIRRLARDARFSRPEWSTSSDAFILAPLVLTGSWVTSDGDERLVSRVAGEPYRAIEQVLIRWRETEDPPFIKSGPQWHATSSDEAFLVLRHALTGTAIERWRTAAIETLTEPDPANDLSPEERPMAGLRGIAREHSGTIRQGIADGIALLGAAEAEEVGDRRTGAEQARNVVRGILLRANEDESGATWASLSDVLPRLAEGAPDAFLDAVHEDLAQPEPKLRAMFRDTDRAAWFHSSSPHTGLLWALETVAWSPLYLVSASRALARLKEIDPGGRLSNRPLESLKAILIPWIRQTSAPLNVKISAIESICRDMPDVGWDVVRALWPSPHGVVTPPSSPRHRDWSPESRTVLVTEWIEYIEKLVDLAIGLAGGAADRWADMSEHLGPLPPEARERILTALTSFAEQPTLSSDDKLVMWERLRSEIGRHRQFVDAEWSMAPEILDRMQAIADLLKPARGAERYAYLFNWHPDLPDVDRRNFSAHEARLQELRQQAVTETLESEGIDGLRTLASRSPVPQHLGLTVGSVAPESMTPALLAWLDSDDPALCAVAASWAGQRLSRDDSSWLRTVLDYPEMNSSERRLAFALSARPTAEVWDALQEIDPGLYDEYWGRMARWGVGASDVARAVDELCDRGRAWIAVDLLAGALQGPEDGEATPISPTLVHEALQAALVGDPTEARSQILGYELGLLLDYLETQGSDREPLVQYEFAFFNLLDDVRTPKALFAALESDSTLFVELVSRVYRGRDEPERKLEERESALAQHAWWVIRHWRGLPGRRDDGSVDPDHLRTWVHEARLAFAESDRADIGDELIGQTLAASPPGDDGAWPAKAVRDIIESIGSPNIESGIHIGVRNDRGTTTRGVFDGGKQEWDLAAMYRAWAECTTTEWPRTSRILRGLAESYEHEARREDEEAARRADTE
jgi:hypothetical protein